MKLAFLFTLAAGLPLFGGASDTALADEAVADTAPTNVNARYIIESVNVLGSETKSLSKSLRAELRQVVGANLDSLRLEKLAGRIKNELRVARVKVHVTKGTVPDHVLVDFEVAKKPVDLKVDKFLYDTKAAGAGTLARPRAPEAMPSPSAWSATTTRCWNATRAFARNSSGTAWARTGWGCVSNSTISTKCGIRRR